MGALGSAISGLQASQAWLDVISNNVSNSQTVAYKSGQVSFSDLVSQGLRSASAASSTSNLGGIDPSQLGLGVQVSTVQIEMAQGATQVTGNATDIAIQGSGFLTVSKGEQTLYTRAGNLTTDNAGNLVTADGGLVQGWSLTQTSTIVAGVMTITAPNLNTSDPSAIGNIEIPSNLVLGPSATSNVAASSIKDQGVVIKGNLDSNTPMNPNSVLGVAAYSAVGVPNVFVPDATATAVVYDSLGNQHTILISFYQTAAVPAAAPAWGYLVNDITGGQQANSTAFNPATGGNNITPAVESLITFNPDGSLSNNGNIAPNLGSNITISEALTNGAVGPGPQPDEFNFSLNFGTDNNVGANGVGQRDGLTGDFGNGTTTPAGVYQPVQTVHTDFVDGYSEGTLTGISFDQTGGINASFSNNQTITVAKLAMSTFSNPDGLAREGGNYYQQTANSGLAQIGTAGANGAGTIQGDALEASNVDLTVELTNMIVAQRMFEANSRVVSVESSVLQTLTQLGQGG